MKNENMNTRPVLVAHAANGSCALGIATLLRVSLLLFFLTGSPPLHAGEVCNLEGMMNEEAEAFPVPESLFKQLVGYPNVHEGLISCQEDGRIDNFKQALAAKPLTLSTNGRPAYIVFPSKYCWEFRGAHAIWFWIMEQQTDGTYANLLSGADDSVEILDNETNGYRDILTRYGVQPPWLYRFNGSSYEGEELADDPDAP